MSVASIWKQIVMKIFGEKGVKLIMAGTCFHSVIVMNYVLSQLSFVMLLIKFNI